MARINLLPWREQRRKQQQQDFIVGIVASVVATCIILLGVYLYIEGMKEYQDRRNQRLQSEISIVNKKVQEIKTIEEKKAKLLTKIEVIQKLQESRPQAVHLFDELAVTIPDGVFLTGFTQKGKALSFSGKAQSNARISAYMRSIDKSDWMNTPKLKVIQGRGDAKEDFNRFSMTAGYGKKKPQDEKKGAKK